MSKQAKATSIYETFKNTKNRKMMIRKIVRVVGCSEGYASTLYNNARKASAPVSKLPTKPSKTRAIKMSGKVERLGTKITTIDRDTCKEMRRAMQAALDGVAQRYGVRIDVNNMSFSDSDINAKVKISTGSKSDEKQREFDRHAFKFGLSGSDFGRDFIVNGRSFTISGLKPRGRKTPIIGTEAGTDKPYRFAADTVRRNML